MRRILGSGELHEFGRHARELREFLGWTIQEASDASGLTKACICQIEQGRREPGLGTAMKLADAYRVTIDRLAYGRDRR
jgi:transcriptional regulator with XRE-family HTH domain